MKKLLVALGTSAALLLACHPHHHHPGNEPPVADAGASRSVARGALVTLDGSASADPDGNELTYAWTLTSRPEGSAATLSDATSVHPTFTADKAGDFVVQLVVDDGKDDSDPATVTITAVDGVPVADAGPAQSVAQGALVSLDGSASADAEGDPLTYAWSLVSRPPGSAAALSDPTAVQPTFTADKAGSYVLQLVVDDGTADSAPASVTITALDAAPVADAGPAQSVATGVLVTLDGSASADANGDPLTYAWSFVSRPAGSAAVLADATAAHPTFTTDAVGEYVVQLVVNDGTLDSAPIMVTITALDDAPVADAGPAQTVNKGALVTLDGSGSSDLNGDPLTYAWTFTSRPVGSAAALDTTDPIHPTFTADVAGAYVVQLVVNDGTLDSAPDTVTVTANLVYVTTDLVVNGSFEDGLGSWLWSASNETGSSGTCSYNLDTAPGTETLTGQTGFPATDGTKVVLGSVSSTSGTNFRANCTMYQDIAIPAGTTALTLSFDIGGTAGVDGCLNTGFFAGLFGTTTVPNLGTSALSGRVNFCVASPSTGLVTVTGSFNPTSLRGTTVRLGLINAANFAGHEVVVLDSVKLRATYPQ